MTKQQRQKREYNRRQIQRMKDLGWKSITYYLPPEVLIAVAEFKNQRMKAWREAQQPASVEPARQEV
jgi:hypothetical protein